MNNALRTTRNAGRITIDKIEKSPFQKAGTLTATLRQIINVIAYYQGKQATDSLTDSLYDNDDFGFEEQSFASTETRVCFLPIPDSETEAGLLEKLAAAPNARIWKCLSNHPILTSQQENSINRGLKTLDEYADSQVIRYPEGHEMAGQIIVRNGKVEYKVQKFSANGKPDTDLRNSTPGDFFVSSAITAELKGDHDQDSVGEYGELQEAEIVVDEQIGQQVM